MIIEYFKEICSIGHCSFDSDRLMNFLVDFAKSRGYETHTDEAKNIYIVKGSPVICMQAHYDMVCVGDAPNIELIEIDGFIKAKNSSLGADNGVAIAMMMVLMDEQKELEFLITANEEVGLLGANGVDFALRSNYMLNLDSEFEGEICIGCSGGVDIKATKKLKKISNTLECYEVSLSDLPGGHSGVDIDKNIPNALIELAKFLKDKDIKIIKFDGGERINSIPANAKAIVACDIELKSEDRFSIRRVEKYDYCYDENVIQIISDFKHGVLEFNESLNIPNISQNLAIIDLSDDTLTVDVSLRAMGMDELESAGKETSGYFKNFGFEVEKKDKYPAWKPEINDFVKKIEEIMCAQLGKGEIKAIHAGLECGVLKQKYPKMKFASMGPTILFPHSKQEMVEISTVYNTFKVVNRIIKEFEK